MRPPKLRLALFGILMGLLSPTRARAAPSLDGAVAINDEPTRVLSGSHADAIVAADGSVLPETGSISSPGPRRVRAEALFQQAVTLAGEGRYAEACPKFEASEALDVGVGTLLHLGDCYENLGRFASAWASFREAEWLARAHSMRTRQEIAMARALSLEPKLSRLRIVVPPASALPGLTIRLGQRRVLPSNWGALLPIDSGPYVITAEANGFQSAELAFEVKGDGPEHVRIVVPKLQQLEKSAPIKPSSAAPSSAPADVGSTFKTLGLVIGATGIAGLGAAGVLAALSAETNEESLAHCPSSANLCNARGLELRDQAGSYADAATVSASVGGAFLVGGVALYVFRPRTPAPQRTGSALQIAPTLSVDGAGLNFQGAF
jgi:hypothetical protein